jgi:hypothetical protein
VSHYPYFGVLILLLHYWHGLDVEMYQIRELDHVVAEWEPGGYEGCSLELLVLV